MKKFSMIFLGIVILIFTACEFEGNSLVINMNDEKKANQIVNELISSIEKGIILGVQQHMLIHVPIVRQKRKTEESKNLRLYIFIDITEQIQVI